MPFVVALTVVHEQARYTTPITQHHAASRSTTQHYAAPRNITQHHIAPRSTT